MLISVFRDAVTAQGFSAVFIGMSSLFAGKFNRNLLSLVKLLYCASYLTYALSNARNLVASEFFPNDLSFSETLYSNITDDALLNRYPHRASEYTSSMDLGVLGFPPSLRC
jgi:ABC-type multidrug transport system permease subunit